MAAPAAPSAVTLAGDHKALTAAWTPADETETQFEVQSSLDDGSTWSGTYYYAAGVTSATLLESDDDVTAKVRVRATNGDGSSAWVASTSKVIPVAPAEITNDGTDVVLFVGELVDGHAVAFNGAGFTNALLSGVSVTGAATLTAAAQAIRERAVATHATHWAKRLAGASMPFRADVASLIWDHVGNSIPITAVAADTPEVGQTQITIAGPVARDVGATFWIRVRGTGLSDMDNLEFNVEVASSTELVISGFVASSSASTGFVDRPSLNNYDSDLNGHTNFRAGGALPSKTYGFEEEVLRYMQDRRSLALGDSTGVPTIAIKLGNPQPLMSRVVGTASTTARWSPDLTGIANNSYDQLSRILTDAKALIDERGATLTPPPYRIAGIVMMHGLNETSGDITKIRAIKNVAAVTVTADVVRIRTSTAHGMTNVATKLYNLARITGIGGTLGDELNGKIRPISVVDDDEFDILDFDATGLSGTVAAGSTLADLGAPCYWFDDLISAQIDAVRALAISKFGTGQDDDLVPVALIRPDYDPEYEALLVGQDSKLSLSVVRAAVESVAGRKSRVGVVNIDDVPHRGDPGGLNSQFYFGHDGNLLVGQRIIESLARPVSLTTTGTPSIVVPIIGHSFVQGRSLLAAGYNSDPELISKQSNPQNGMFAWNMTTQAIEPLVLDPDMLSGTYNGYTNLTSSSVYHPGGWNTASFQVAYLQELKIRFPDHNIYLLNLGVNGSTAATHETALTSGDVIESVTVASGVVTIKITLRAGQKPIKRTSTFPVTISGVTGLSTSINGSFTATPINVSTTANLQGTQEFTINVFTSGTPVLTDARAKFPEPIWDPSANDIWDHFEAQTAAFFDAMHAAGIRPDCRCAAIALAENDIFRQTDVESYKAAMRRIINGLVTLYTTRTQPRNDIAISLMKAVRHGRFTGSTDTLSEYEAAQTALAGEYPNVTLVNVDENNDRLLDPVTISTDNIHPDYKGYVALGYQLAKALDNVPNWDAPRDTSLSGSGSVAASSSVIGGGVTP